MRSLFAIKLAGPGLFSLLLILMIYQHFAFSTQLIAEPVQACVIARDVDLTDAIRAQFAQCLGWQTDESSPLCHGSYQPITVTPFANLDEVHVLADTVSFYKSKRSTLSGHVEVQQGQKIVNAQTAYVYSDEKTNKVNKIEFLGAVRYLEPNRLMIARKASINPEDKSGQTEDVLYRFNIDRRGALLPAWGRASLIQRFANKDYLMRRATYTTCAPQDKAWDIAADSITLSNAQAKGVARNARLHIHNIPVFYTPYFSFPTSKERKSGFLMPLVGYSNVGGLDFGLPWYWNIAPNHDATLFPHLYSKRGLMMGGEYRFLTPDSLGIINGNFLPQDKAYKDFLQRNELEFPRLQGDSANRWSVGVLETTHFNPELQLNINVQQVSDDYYLQDFSTNLAVITQRQLLRQADLTYSNDHWILRGMGQSYQTLHPVNESPISNVYERLPQLMAEGLYYDLPLGANFSILGQYDQFHWPGTFWETANTSMPQGPRFHLNPVLSLPQTRPWGYFTPALQIVDNYYQVQNSASTFNANAHFNPNFNPNFNPGHSRIWNNMSTENGGFNRAIPRYSVDSGLYFERNLSIHGSPYIQTLEPRLFYLNVPYSNQSTIPVYDSAYMIFNVGQLFRTNRFSGFDRIGDTNQLSYALTSRWLFADTGAERASLSIGQIKYFANRKVQLCQNKTGYCLDNPLSFGYLSPLSETSPIASRGVFYFNPVWSITGDYVWDTATRATNNSDLNLHYQPHPNELITLGYSYLVNGDITHVRNNVTTDNALHQATLAFAWPLTDRWSTVGAYSQNISKSYSMMSLAGLQYDSCCWAVRFLGGRTFKSLNANYQPQYNNNVYLQILLKGLGSVANSDPGTLLNTYLPGYNDSFTH